MSRNPKSESEAAEQAESRGWQRFRWSPENDVTDKVIGAAIEVHRHLGPGLMESAYEECLCYELSQKSLTFKRQVHLPIAYKTIRLDCAYKMDLVVEGLVVVEIKSVDQLLPIHSAQLITYLRASGKRIGLLINFNVTTLKQGLKRIANRYTDAPAPRVSAPSARESGEENRTNTCSPQRPSALLGDSAVSKEHR